MEIETLKHKLKLAYDFIEEGCGNKPPLAYGDYEYHEGDYCSECGIVWCSCISKGYLCRKCHVSHCTGCRPRYRKRDECAMSHEVNIEGQ